MSEPTTTYERLAAEFPETHEDPFKRDPQGNPIRYITGEQVISRLNDTLGVAGWSFKVKEHGYHEAADELWVLGSLEATIDGELTIKEQFGSCELKRKRADHDPVDLGNDLKGAATEALKKCAMALGVGLYMTHRGGARPTVSAPLRNQAPAARAPQPAPSQPTPQPAPLNIPPTTLPQCAECGRAIGDYRKPDGTVLTAARIAALSDQYFKRPLCAEHYNAALKGRREPAGSAPERAADAGGAAPPGGDELPLAITATDDPRWLAWLRVVELAKSLDISTIPPLGLPVNAEHLARAQQDLAEFIDYRRGADAAVAPAGTS